MRRRGRWRAVTFSPAWGGRRLDRVLQPKAESTSATSPDLRPVHHQRAGGVRRSAGPRGVVAAASAISGHPGVHWNITVLDPSWLVPMFEIATCDPLTMQ